MQKHALVLATSAFILACGAMPVRAQEPMMQQPPTVQLQQEMERKAVQTPGRGVEDEDDDTRDGMITGWGHGPGWRQQHGDRGMGMMGGGGMRGPGAAGSGMMMRMLFAMMDGDGDGTVSLPEFQAAHERIFKAMDANKDGRLTLEEIQAFMQGARTPAPR